MSVVDPVDVDRSFLFVIDIQDRLLPSIHEHEAVVDRSVLMIDAAKILGLPVVWTEQYVKGLGPTNERVRKPLEEIGATPVEKLTFSCCPVVGEQLAGLGRKQVIVVGIEAHVCVQQTVLELLRTDYEAYVLADAVGSRRPLDYDVALLRMQQAGAVITTVESMIFELLKQAGTDAFKSILKIVK
jgi:nicotinamidase-related amidase